MISYFPLSKKSFALSIVINDVSPEGITIIGESKDMKYMDALPLVQSIALQKKKKVVELKTNLKMWTHLQNKSWENTKALGD